MALKDFSLNELLDLAETAIARMWAGGEDTELERLQGFSLLQMVMPFIRAEILGTMTSVEGGE
jgi:hypothetical protein